MFESVTQKETAIIYIIFGLILFFTSFSVMIVFICYKELRHGIYGMIICTIVSEVYLGLHLIINGASGLLSTHEEHLKSLICKFDGLTTIFFFSFWCCQNIFIMYLSMKRKLLHTRLTKIYLFFSLLISVMISAMSFLTDNLTPEYSDDCYIANIKSTSAIVLIFLLFSLKFVFSAVYNFWFFFYRDTSKDRSFINGYNYFILITSFLFGIFILNAFMVYICKIDSVTMQYISFISFFICCVYISYSRMQIEYVQIILSHGPSEWKIINLFMFLGCCYPKPKFRDMKKVLNVKLIVQPNQQDLDETIYSKILRGNDI